MKIKSLSSPESLKFIKENIKKLNNDFKIEDIINFRKLVKLEFKSQIESISEKYKPSLKIEKINSIDCLEISPTSISNDCLILFFHGGGFIAGNPHQSLMISAVIAHFTESKVVTPFYRLAPENPYPASIDDCFKVLKYLIENMPSSKLAILGASAGGNAALVSLLKLQDTNLSMPSSLSLLSPWSDLMHNGDSHSANEGRDPKLNMNWINEAVKGYAYNKNLNVPSISPINGDYRDFPNTFITSGTRDLFLSQCIRLNNILKSNNILSNLKIWENMWHTFEMHNDIPEAEQSLMEVSTFIKSNFNQSALE